jgi:hypothetical protein
MTKKLRRLFTSPPARFLRIQIRKRLKEDAESGLRSNWMHQANVKEMRVTL